MKQLILCALALIAFNPAFAQTPQSVVELLKADYEIVSINPVTDSYAVFLKKGASVVICQIGIDGAGKAFSTDKCYPLTK